jgi:hypothetical protein
VQNGDLSVGQLESKVNTDVRNELIVQSWHKHAEDRQTIVFCVDIQHAKDLAQAFVRGGVPASAVWGQDEGRRRKIEQHRHGELKVLTNCSVFTEGYDDPSVGCIVLARPTLSQPLFVQMIGRGTRLQPGIDNLVSAVREGRVITKPDCIVLDVTDNTERHRLMSMPVAFGLDPEIQMSGRSFASVLSRCDREHELCAEMDSALATHATAISIVSEYIDLFAPAWHDDVLTEMISRWYRQADAFIRPLPDEGFVRIARTSGKWRVSGRINGQGISLQPKETFAEASGEAERVFRALATDVIERIQSERRNSEGRATPTQFRMLRECGEDCRFTELSWEEAEHRLIRAFERDLEARCLNPTQFEQAQGPSAVRIESSPQTDEIRAELGSANQTSVDEGPEYVVSDPRARSILNSRQSWLLAMRDLAQLSAELQVEHQRGLQIESGETLGRDKRN